ncbi:hypothetical protein SEA_REDWATTLEHOG_136 [Gordonia phage RedWattleHog]|uniref:Uncharacterized protein n=1 Tax=Gordonia phage Stormageddon TaxID=2656541 RepID=A0A649VS24_9CAUD|nr:hypothetical protein KHQ86_gp166 [Gordonia phage Stormageddon]QGJ94994.1 hypothetical protein SEA_STORMAGEDDON_134 [Gordonia phage Stormageddon]QLF83639.1 hypothetical protein SEA_REDWATTLEHOG_136 [Gordonia phage RedWattleHog]
MTTMATATKRLRCEECNCFVSEKEAETSWEPEWDDDHGRPIGAWVRTTRCNNPNCPGDGEVYLGLAEYSEVYG